MSRSFFTPFARHCVFIIFVAFTIGACAEAKSNDSRNDNTEANDNTKTEKDTVTDQDTSTSDETAQSTPTSKDADDSNDSKTASQSDETSSKDTQEAESKEQHTSNKNDEDSKKDDSDTENDDTTTKVVTSTQQDGEQDNPEVANKPNTADAQEKTVLTVPELSVPQNIVDEFRDSLTISTLSNSMTSIHKTINSDITYLSFSLKVSPAELNKAERFNPLIAAALLDKGSKTFPRKKLIDTMEKYALNLSCGPQAGCSMGYLQLECSMSVDKAYLDQGLEVFSSVILEPNFDQEEYDIYIENAKADITKACKKDLDTQVNNLVNTIYYDHTHPYFSTHGQLQKTLKLTSRDQVQQTYSRFLNGHRATLISLSSVPATELNSKLSDYFRTMPFWYTNEEDRLIRAPKHSEKDVVVEYLEEEASKDDSTVYVILKALVPGKRSPDNIGLGLLHRVLHGKVFESVRSIHSLSYAPFAYYRASELGHSFLEVSTKQPIKATQLMIDELKKMQTQLISKEELDEYRNLAFTLFYYSASSPTSIASQISRNHYFFKNLNPFTNYPTDVMKITTQDIQNLAKTYLKNYKLAVIGAKEIVGKAEDYQHLVDQLK